MYKDSRNQHIFQFSRIHERYFVFSRIKDEIVFTHERFFHFYEYANEKKANSRLLERRWGPPYGGLSYFLLVNSMKQTYSYNNEKIK